MSKVLDLSVFKEETLDITMPDKKVIHIIKPTQRMAIQMMRFKNINENAEPEQIINTFNSMVLAILNSNDAGIVYTNQLVDEMPMRMKTAIIVTYGEFVNELQSDPN